jgi:preprotein translocase subunit SecD
MTSTNRRTGAAALILLAGLTTTACAGSSGNTEANTPPRPTATVNPTAPNGAPITVDRGPRTLNSPIEVRPVISEVADTTCAPTADQSPAATGDSCYTLGATALTIRRVANLDTGAVTNDNASMQVFVTMNAADQAAFTRLTTANVDKRLALVVEGTVYSAPTVAQKITGGQVAVILHTNIASGLLSAITGPATDPSLDTGPAVRTGPQSLNTPIQIQPVNATTTGAPCAAAVTGQTKVTTSPDGTTCYQLGKPALSIRDIRNIAFATTTNPNATADFQVVLTLNPADTATYADFTGSTVGKAFAIVVGNTVYSAPTVAQKITSGNVAVTANRHDIGMLVAKITG